MLKKLINYARRNGQNFDMTGNSGESGEIRRFIKEANSLNNSLREFLSQEKDAKFISLGENCNTAWYLKQVGVKKASYPFDWIFSSPEIIIDCIEDNFSKFLDKSMIYPKIGGKSAGHIYYHESLFNHRNPLTIKNYEYYQRCCKRFTKDLTSGESIVYVITLINEHEKRPGWAKGFTKNFHAPKNQDLSSVQGLMDLLTSYNKRSKFIVVDQYTNQTRKVYLEKMDESVFFFKFHAGGENTGVYYTDILDDFCCKLIFSALS